MAVKDMFASLMRRTNSTEEDSDEKGRILCERLRELLELEQNAGVEGDSSKSLEKADAALSLTVNN